MTKTKTKDEIAFDAWMADGGPMTLAPAPALPPRDNISPDLERRMRAAVFEALNNAAEGGHDHASDGMPDAEICDSLFDYDEACADLVEEAAGAEGEGVGYTPILGVHVAAWRAARAGGVPLPVPHFDVGQRVVYDPQTSPARSGVFEGILPNGRLALTLDGTAQTCGVAAHFVTSEVAS